MKVSLDSRYFINQNSGFFGYMGEIDSREIIFDNYEVEGADSYKLRISYSDGVQYDISIEDGKCVVHPSLLRDIGFAELQVLAVAYRDGDFTYVKKSNIFRAEIKESLNGESEPIPTYEEAIGALEKVLNIEDTASKNADRAEEAATKAETSATNAEASAKSAQGSAEGAVGTYYEVQKSAESAATSATNAAESESNAENSAKTAQNFAGMTMVNNESAQTAAKSASESADNAKKAKSAAETAAKNSEMSAANSEASAAKAEESAEAANNSAQLAQSAQALAETAQKAAETSASEAADSLSSANTAAENAAQSAKSASESADKAETAETSAESAMNSAKSYADSAAESESNAKASAESAKAVADSIPTDYSELSEMVDTLTRTKADGIVETVEGKTITANDCSDMPLRGLRIFGKTTQGDNPTPDNPQELVSLGAEGNIEVSIAGYNLFDKSDTSGWGYSENKAVRSKILQLEPNTAYTASTNYAGSDIWFMLSNDSPTAAYSVKKGSPTTITTDDTGVAYIMIRQTYFDKILSAYNIMINEGSAALPYCDYDASKHKQIITLSTPNGLPGIKVDSGGNYTDEDGQQWICDEIDLERGVYVQRCYMLSELKTVSASISESYALVNASTCPTPNTTIGSVLCNITNHYFVSWAPQSYPTNIFLQTSEQRRVVIAFNSEMYPTAESVQEVLDNGVYVIYPLAAPIETALTDEEISTYKSLHTNKLTTTFDSEAYMSVDYTADTKTYIDNKFTELQQALLSTGGDV